jgi:cysteine desulfurase
LGVKAEELFFTSGGTESNAIVLFSLLSRIRSRRGAELLYSAVEHPSVGENAAVLSRLGIACTAIPVEKDGRVSMETLKRTLVKNPAPRMAAIMAVNNETGAINDIKALGAVLGEGTKTREERDGAPETPLVFLHCDVVQAAGKIPLDLPGGGADSASLSAHKIGGSRGIGLLWLKRPLFPLIRGGGQEGGIRPGTENTAGALALAEALESRLGSSLAGAREEAAARMKALMGALRGTGRFLPIPADREDDDPRFSPWILQGAFMNGEEKIIPGELLVRALDERGFALSTGSACSRGNKKRSVLEAMGAGAAALGGIRISQGWSTTMEDMETLAEAIGELCRTL